MRSAVRRLVSGSCLLMAACGGGSGSPADSTAVGSRASGFLVVDATTARLCPVLAESYPPQCGGQATTVVGLDVTQVRDVQSAGGVQWTDRSITLLGDRAGDVLTVPVTVTGSVIVGRATAGPVCPVERVPPDPACAARSVEGASIRVHGGGSGRFDVTVVTDATGRYAIRVPAGDYEVAAQPAAGLMGTPAPVSVLIGGTPITQDLVYDTGIR